jgi:hypothetical protein
LESAGRTAGHKRGRSVQQHISMFRM